MLVSSKIIDNYNINKNVCHVSLTAQESETIINRMQLKKPYLAFIFFILVNIGQTFAQSTESLRFLLVVPQVQLKMSQQLN